MTTNKNETREQLLGRLWRAAGMPSTPEKLRKPPRKLLKATDPGGSEDPAAERRAPPAAGPWEKGWVDVASGADEVWVSKDGRPL